MNPVIRPNPYTMTAVQKIEADAALKPALKDFLQNCSELGFNDIEKCYLAYEKCKQD